MSRVVLIEAAVRDAGAVPATVRLAGGGKRGYTQFGHHDWRAGIVAEPKFSAQLGFEEGGWTTGGLGQSSDLVFSPATVGLASTLARLMWLDATLTVWAGDERTGNYGVRLVGAVGQASAKGGAVTLTIGDMSLPLLKPVAPDTFAGTGGLEGSSDAAGRVKRRSFGRVFNVEGLLLDAASNVYEFGDTGLPLAGMVSVRDKGRSGPLNILGAQGTAQITLDVLKASTPPDGGATIAPSIACAKWWTTPAGPLTADLEGEIGSGYGETAAEIAAALVAGTGVTVADIPGGAALRPAPAGLHIGDGSETTKAALDRLLVNVSLLWVLGATSTIAIREWTWSNPVETLKSSAVSRTALYRPVGTRTLGYQKNERIQSDSEIAGDIDDQLSDAQSDAAEALARIAVIDSDGWLSAGEKPDVIRLVQTFTDEGPVLAAQAGRLGITGPLATLQAAKLALDTYLGGLSPAWNDVDHDTAIDPATFQGRFTDYEYARTLLVTAIADVASTKATWVNVSGVGKPADGADVTETAFQLIAGRPIAQVVADLNLNGQNYFQLGQTTASNAAIAAARTTLNGVPIGTVVSNLTTTVTDNNTAIVEQLNLIGAKSGDGQSWILNLDTVRVGTNTSLADKFGTFGASIDALNGSLGDVNTKLDPSNSSGVIYSLAQSISGLQASYGSVNGSVTSLQQVLVGSDGTVETRAILSLNANGQVRGMVATNTGDTSSLEFLFDSYNLLAPDGSSLIYASNGTVYMPRVVVNELDVNTAMVPVRVVSATHVAGTYSGTGVAGPVTAQLTASIVVAAAGWVEASVSWQQGLVGTDGPFSGEVQMDGNRDGYSYKGSGAHQDVLFTQGYFKCPGPGTYTLTFCWAAVPGIELRERSMFIKFFPNTQ